MLCVWISCVVCGLAGVCVCTSWGVWTSWGGVCGLAGGRGLVLVGVVIYYFILSSTLDNRMIGMTRGKKEAQDKHSAQN